MKPAQPLPPSNRMMSDVALPPAAAASPPATRLRSAPESGEAVLVERARARDEEAFGMLVDLHRDRAFAVALRITRSREDAADVAQEAFVRAWQALPNFRGESAFGTWLHRIVARRALDRAGAMRTRAARETPVEVLPEPAAPADREPEVDAGRLERLLAQLSPAQRAIVTLFYGQDVPVASIARTLGLPANTVKTHLRRARGTLREAWRHEEEA